MKTFKTKTKMNVVNFHFGTGHYIVAKKGNAIRWYKAECVLSPFATRRIVASLIEEMSKYVFEVTKQGTRMDGEPLYRLVVKDSSVPKCHLFYKTIFDELYGYEVENYKEYFNKHELGEVV